MSQADKASLRTLYDGCAGSIYALALRILKDGDRAQEALKRTFGEVWRLSQAGKAGWEMPDLEMFRICREHAGKLVRQSPALGGGDAEFAMSDPVRTGSASFELLAMLQALGGMSTESRNAISVAYFDCPSREALAAQLSLAPDDLTIYLRRCYSEYVEASNSEPIGIDRETDLIAMIQALGLAAQSEGASDDPLRHVWELRIAPLAELLEPVPPPEGAFGDIHLHGKPGAGGSRKAKPKQKTEIRRALTYVAVAAVLGILIYVALVAVNDGTTTQPASTVQESN